MKLVAYPTNEPAPVLEPAPSHREWLEFIPQKYAYRCLPLTIANSHGWQILSPLSFELVWDGSKNKDGLKIRLGVDGDDPADTHWRPQSHFGNGVLTMHPGYLFQTEPSVNMMVMGPPNHRKDGIQALSGMVETDWSPFGFTMNWVMTRPHTPVRFAKGEAFCFLFPLTRGLLNSVEPEIRSLSSDNPTLDEQHRAWNESRANFLKDMKKAGTEAHEQRWQKSYYLGKHLDGSDAVADHQIKLQLAPFRDRRSAGDTDDTAQTVPPADEPDTPDQSKK